MKVGMGDTKHLQVILGHEHQQYNEIIIDRERCDVRVRIGNSIIKLQYEGNHTGKSHLKAILLDDIFVWREKGYGK